MWLVAWTVTIAVMVGCPIVVHPPICDEFGRCTERTRNTQTLELCFDYQNEQHSREFENKRKARAFYERLLEEIEKQNPHAEYHSGKLSNPLLNEVE